MSALVTVQVFDWMYGRPASGVCARLHRVGDPAPVGEEVTDDTGRCHFALDSSWSRQACRLVLATDPYFTGLGVATTCPEATVTFHVGVAADLLLLLAPFGHLVYVGR
jgi:5-hydroxyisourate hydrolase-like protein (transthyretin family)